MKDNIIFKSKQQPGKNLWYFIEEKFPNGLQAHASMMNLIREIQIKITVKFYWTITLMA